MGLRCEGCGTENPPSNRFCGSCGRPLRRSSDELPEEFWREADSPGHAQPSANLPPEVIEFDNQIPLIAEEGSDRRIHTPNHLAEEAHERLEREAEVHDSLRHASDSHYGEQQRRESTRSDFLRWEENPTPAHRPRIVSGPSFLGLGEEEAAEQEEDEQPERENGVRYLLAAAILAVAIVLVAVQWRPLRNYAAGLWVEQSAGTQNTAASSAANTSSTPAPSSAEQQKRSLGMAPLASASSAVEHTTAPQHPSPEPQPSVPASRPLRANVHRPAAMAAPPEPVVAPARPRSTPRIVVPGAEEMQRAASASDAEARAAWLWRAVGKGNSLAPVELAQMYERGEGVVQSCDQARLLLRSAAAHGNAEASQNLRRMLFQGKCAGR